MSDLLLGVIIGGLIGIVPTIVSSFIEVWKMKTQQKHEINVKKFELYQTQKTASLLQYVTQLGALNNGSLSSDFGIDKYFAAAENAACFVPDEVRRLIFSANTFAANWHDGFNHDEFMKIQAELTEQLYLQLSCDNKI